ILFSGPSDIRKYQTGSLLLYRGLSRPPLPHNIGLEIKRFLHQRHKKYLTTNHTRETASFRLSFAFSGTESLSKREVFPLFSNNVLKVPNLILLFNCYTTFLT